MNLFGAQTKLYLPFFPPVLKLVKSRINIIIKAKFHYNLPIVFLLSLMYLELREKRETPTKPTVFALQAPCWVSARTHYYFIAVITAL